MKKENLFKDTIILVRGANLIPLRLQINEEGITFSAKSKEGQELNPLSFRLIQLLDEYLHQLGIPEKAGEDIKKSGMIIISFK